MYIIAKNVKQPIKVIPTSYHVTASAKRKIFIGFYFNGFLKIVKLYSITYPHKHKYFLIRKGDNSFNHSQNSLSNSFGMSE